MIAPANRDHEQDASHAKSVLYQNNLLKSHMPNAEVSHVAVDIFSASDMLQETAVEDWTAECAESNGLLHREAPPSSAFRHEHAIPSRVCGEIPAFGTPPNHGTGPLIHSSL
jgi:hypothetical protein